MIGEIEQMIQLYAVEVGELTETDYYQYIIDYLCEETKMKLEKYHNIEDRIRSGVGVCLIKYMLSMALEGMEEEVLVKRNQCGKPYLLNYENPQFNISHSGNWVVGAIGSGEIGIDIERKDSILVSQFKKIFSEEEWESIKNSKDSLDIFYRLWTMKESYVKAEGRGLTIPLNSFQINLSDYKVKDLDGNHIKNYNIKQIEKFSENYNLAICYETNQRVDDVKIIRTKELMDVLGEKGLSVTYI